MTKREKCDRRGCDSPALYRGLCPRHNKEARVRGTGLPVPPIVGPEELPVRYRQRGEVHGAYAVFMPYPEFTGDEPCRGKEDMYLLDDSDEHDYVHPTIVRRAQELCATCPIVVQCQEWAISHEIAGIWGGLLPSHRKNVRVKRRQAFIDPMYADRAGIEGRGSSFSLDSSARLAEKLRVAG